MAGALAAGVLPFLERVLRRAGDPSLLQGLLRFECRWWPALGWLLAYGGVRQGASLIATVRKLAGQNQTQQQPLRRLLTSVTFVKHVKAADILSYAVHLGRRAGGASFGGGDGGSGGGSGFPVVPGGQVGAAAMDSPGMPRLQLLLWYGVRQLMPLMAQVVTTRTSAGDLWAKGEFQWAAAYSLVSNVLRPVAVLALQIASARGGGSDGGGGSGTGRSGRGAAEDNGNSSGATEDSGSGCGCGSPPAWLSSWRRVLLEEWRVVELVGSALELLVPVIGPYKDGPVIFEKILTMHLLMGAVCSVALAFPDQVWSAAGVLGAGTQGKEWQAKGSQRGGGSSSSSSSKGGGKRAAPGAAQSSPVCAWPTSRVVQLLDAARPRVGKRDMCYLVPELDALSQLVDLVKAGGPELPYKYDTPFVQATLKLKTDSDLLGGFRWCGGEGPSPELLDGLLRTCSYPRCASLDGDSEAGRGGRLAACGRGCGRTWYCSKACAKAHWREGHAEACGGGAAAEGPGTAGCSGSSSVS